MVFSLGLAMACVFVTTLVLLANLLGSIYVLVCVALTLVNLCGYMHFWGLTIDVVSSVNIIIAIGKFGFNFSSWGKCLGGSKRNNGKHSYIKNKLLN